MEGDTGFASALESFNTERHIYRHRKFKFVVRIETHITYSAYRGFHCRARRARRDQVFSIFSESPVPVVTAAARCRRAERRQLSVAKIPAAARLKTPA